MNLMFYFQLKEQAADSISVLEGALRLKRDFYVHTLRTLELLAADAAANGETESSTAGLCISADELHCQVKGQANVFRDFQDLRLSLTAFHSVLWHVFPHHLFFLPQVHYDLGGIFFHQGCTDQSAYEKAREHFRQTKEILKKV